MTSSVFRANACVTHSISDGFASHRGFMEFKIKMKMKLVGYRISHSYNKWGTIVNSESYFIDNENKEYEDCDINNQVIN
jgi:hypothetical protein